MQLAKRSSPFLRVLVPLVVGLALSAMATAGTELKFALPFPPGTKDYKAVKYAASKVESVTEGRITFAWTEVDMKVDSTEELFAGRLDLTLVPTAGLSEHAPSAALLSLPMLCRDLAEAEKVMALIDPKLKQELSAKGITSLAGTGIGFTYLMSVVPVTTPDQLRTSRLWVPDGEAFSHALGGVGAITVPTPMNDVLPALKRAKEGDVDAPTTLIGWPSLVVARRWHTEITDVLDLPFFYVDTRLLAREAALRDVSQADRQVMAAEFGRAFDEIRELQLGYHQQYERALKRYGATFHVPTETELKGWEEFGRQWGERVAKERGIDPEMMEEVDRLLERERRNR